MKHSITVFASLLLLFGCNKKVYEIELPTYGETEVEINGQEWRQDIKALTYDSYGRFSFSAFKYKNIDGIEVIFETLNVYYVAKNSNKQRFGKYRQQSVVQDSFKLYTFFATNQDDGDVSCDMFRVLESDSANNWIQVNKEKNDYKEVWGTYNATFLRTSGCPSSPYSDTLRFRNGVFHFKFE